MCWYSKTLKQSNIAYYKTENIFFLISTKNCMTVFSESNENMKFM